MGVSQIAVEALTDTNMVMQKLNRYVSPNFSMIRTKAHNLLSGTVVAMYIPESKGKTHMFVKEVQYRHPSGKTKQLAYAGMIFFRRSATNNVVSPEDLEFIINRRIEHYKESIMSKIAKVVEAPADHQILVFDPAAKADGGKSYYISDSPDAMPVKGMSFTIVPSTDVEELCGWISLSKRDPTFHPSQQRLWYLYSVRDSLILTSEQMIGLFGFSLIAEVPVFFWIKSLNAEEIEACLLQLIDSTKDIRFRANAINIGAFLGKTFHSKLLKKLGDDIKKLNLGSRKFPEDPYKAICVTINQHDEDKADAETKLTELALQLSKDPRDVLEKLRAKALDCYLYARKDKYRSTTF